MQIKRMGLVLLIATVVLAVFVSWPSRNSNRSTVFAAPPPVGDRFSMTAGTYRFAGSPELSTVVIFDAQTGKTFFLRVRNITGSDGKPAGVAVEWAPMSYASQ